MGFAPRVDSAPKFEDVEHIEIRTLDHVALAASVLEPTSELRGTIVCAHNLFADRKQWLLPRGDGLMQQFAGEGYRCIAFDFRGHGESASDARINRSFGYDDLVFRDLPAVVESCRARMGDEPLFVAGHSLGGTVALAALAANAIQVDGALLCATNVWLKTNEHSQRRWLAKLAIAFAMQKAWQAKPYISNRTLHLPAIESARFIEDILAPSLKGRWESRDGVHDFRANLAGVSTPIAALLSEGDRILCRIESGKALVASCSGATRIAVARSSTSGPAPGHMGILQAKIVRPLLLESLRWLEQQHALGAAGAKL